ncbi:MAG: hypothetical protein KGJ43_04605 [Acidobacteriota bacterium]|nr:hypothetical protein [Acidobacteriota bacterium]
MAAGASSGSGDDWRLKARLGGGHKGAVEEIVARFRHEGLPGAEATAVPERVVITHDGSTLFAYAATQDELAAARAAIEDVLARDGVDAALTVSTWEDAADSWRQVDPPLAGEAEQAQERTERDAAAPETRTLVANVGRLVRREIEESMVADAQQLGLRCEVVEHPHLLTTQVAFTVSGPAHKVQEFATDLSAECGATLRADGEVFAAGTL